MSMIQQMFKFEKSTVSVINNSDDIWFRGKTVAKILGYSKTNTVKVINKYVDSDDRCKMSELLGASKMEVPENDLKTIYINESGLYSLILRSKLENAKNFKRWVTKDVLPTIRKTGKYEVPKTDALQERRLKIDEINTFMNVYEKIDNPKLKTVIMDWMHNTISGQKAISDESTQYARDITDICKDEFGFIPDFGQKIKIGQLLKREYVKKFDEPLLKFDKYCNGSMRKVNAYAKDKEGWIIETLKTYDNW